MKRIIVIALFAVATIGITGCTEKTAEEKLQDAAEKAQKSVEKGAKDLNKKLDSALDQ